MNANEFWDIVAARIGNSGQRWVILIDDEDGSAIVGEGIADGADLNTLLISYISDGENSIEISDEFVQ